MKFYDPQACCNHKTLFVIIDEEAKQDKNIFPANPFNPSLIFASKAGAYQTGAPFRCYTMLPDETGFCLYPQMLEQVGKSRHGQTL